MIVSNPSKDIVERVGSKYYSGLFGTASTRSTTLIRKRISNVDHAIFHDTVQTSAFCVAGVRQTRVRSEPFGRFIYFHVPRISIANTVPKGPLTTE